MVFLSKIFIYPIKSLDGVEVDRVGVLPSGALQGDREFAIVDSQGDFVNGKRIAAIHKIRARFDLAARTVSLWKEADPATTFHLDRDRPALESWLSHYFGFPITLIQNTDVGFPDDLNSPGPTVISTETLQAITDWFPDLTLEAIRRRFRTNLELAGSTAFWEDTLFGETTETVPFQIGEVQLQGVNPCQRCIVPTRDAETGASYPQFQKVFVTKRKETLPAEVSRSRFNHFYRLAINTQIPESEAQKVLHIGDRVLRSKSGNVHLSFARIARDLECSPAHHPGSIQTSLTAAQNPYSLAPNPFNSPPPLSPPLL